MQLTLQAPFIRAERYFRDAEVVSARPGELPQRLPYAAYCARVRRLASTLPGLGLAPGDRVATLTWNDHRHLELYFALPCAGLVLHTVNIRLDPRQIAYILRHAGDRALFVSPDLLPVVEAIADELPALEAVVVMDDACPRTSVGPAHAYEALVEAGDPGFVFPPLDEHATAGMCFTSATTGDPKGVEYSHRALYLHSQMLCNVDTLAISGHDVLLPIVPMFHVNAWGLPFAGLWMGAKLVLPGRHADAERLLDLIEAERVTFAAGAVTVGIDMLEAQRRRPRDVSSLRALMLGGQTTPESVARAWRDEFGVPLYTAWGATETAPIATTFYRRPGRALNADEDLALRRRQGIPVPGVELSVRDASGAEVPWDDQTVGEVYARGPWVAREYCRDARSAEGFVDGWWRSGDMATVDADGVLRLVDRAKDLIKSGGEWIPSVALEGALMALPGVREAAVVAVPHPRWVERPLAVVALEPGAEADAAALIEGIAARFPRWWLPDRVAFVEAVPRTSVGKFDKRRLRDQAPALMVHAARVREDDD